MKLLFFLVFLLCGVMTLSADKNWIEIKPLNHTQTSKSTKKLDINMSQIAPINTMMQKLTVVKQLIEISSKKEIPVSNDKNWIKFNKKGEK